MKKLFIFMTVAALSVIARADISWTTWLENPTRTTDLSFGVATKCANVSAFELAFLYGGSCVEDGVQLAFPGINDSDRSEVLQMSMWFNRGDKSYVQIGCINIAKENVFDCGFLNIADKSKIQVGLLNFNRNGFLPIFPFINLDKSLFE